MDIDGLEGARAAEMIYRRRVAFPKRSRIEYASSTSSFALLKKRRKER